MIKNLLLIFLTITIFACQKNGDANAQKNDETLNKNEDKLEELIKIADNEMLVATIKTNMGEMELELYPKETPKTVKNFVGLIEKGYYEGVTFHRIIADFMIQGGDPTGTGSGGESIYGKSFEDELVPSLLHTGPGILSMANAGPNTNGSQFFITLKATPWLNGKHTVFGKLISGMDVLMAIGNVKTTKPFDKPVSDVVMEKVTVEKRAKN